MSPLRAVVSLAILRAANAIVPPREPVTRLDLARFQIALLDVGLRLDGRGSLADHLADLTEPPPSTLRSAKSETNARGGAA